MSFDDPFRSSDVHDGGTSPSFNAFGVGGGGYDDDPAAEFLEREKRELGDIAGGDTDSFEDPFGSRATTNQSPSLLSGTTATGGMGRNSLLTNGAHSPMVGGSISPLPDYAGSRSDTPTSHSGGQYSALSQLDEQQNEPEKIKKWKEEFAQRIVKKDADEEAKRKEMREQAKKELDDFYKQRVEQMERARDQNRQNNRTLEDDLFHSGPGGIEGGKSNGGKSTANDWNKITSLCEFNPKNNRSQKDLTRYRSILLQLKQDQQQPNAK